MPHRTRLKVCCIASVEEARVAVACGADAVGLVGRMPSGPGPIPDERIRAIAAAVPPPVARFLLTSETEGWAIADHVRRTGVCTVQIVDDSVEAEVYERLRGEAPLVRIVQVVHVVGEESIGVALRVAGHVDALLLDSGRPAARELGGTGRRHDWSISRRIVESCGVPVFLAGGLNAENVLEAVREVGPWGVDLCTGVRTGGRLDEGKLRGFVGALGEG